MTFLLNLIPPQKAKFSVSTRFTTFEHIEELSELCTSKLLENYRSDKIFKGTVVNPALQLYDRGLRLQL